MPIENANAERNIEGNYTCTTRIKVKSLPTSDIRQELFCAKCSLQFGNKSVFYLHVSIVHSRQMVDLKKKKHQLLLKKTIKEGNHLNVIFAEKALLPKEV